MQPNLDVLSAQAHPSKPVTRNIVSAGRRALPINSSPVEASVLRSVVEQDESGNDSSDSDGDELEEADRFELRRQFFEQLVTEWKSRRAVNRTKVVTDPQRSVPAMFGHSKGHGYTALWKPVVNNGTILWTNGGGIVDPGVDPSAAQTLRVNQNANAYSLFATMLVLPLGRTSVCYYAHAHTLLPRQSWMDALHAVATPSVTFPGFTPPTIKHATVIPDQGRFFQADTQKCAFFGKMHLDAGAFVPVHAGTAPFPPQFRCHLNNTILDVLVHRGLLQSQSETQWTLGWVGRPWVRGVYSQIHIDGQQRVNHCRNFFELTRKDALSKNVKKLRRAMATRARAEQPAVASSSQALCSKDSAQSTVSAGSTYSLLHESFALPEVLQVSITPDTYVLPKELKMFLEAFKLSSAPSWIMKPVARCQGQGIFLFDKLKAVQDWVRAYHSEEQAAEVYVVQEYISRPLLVGRKKFDLRLYVLVSSYEPLTVWLNRGGFCRFSSSRFSMDKEDRANNLVHLTNVAVQKGGADYDGESGGKWGVGNLKTYLKRVYGAAATEAAMLGIQDCILKSQLSVKTVTVCDETSFALYGFDVMLDDQLKSWVIEVNACPSLSANTPHDYNLKFAMLTDALSIVDAEHSRTGLETTVGGWDQIFGKQKHVVSAPSLGRPKRDDASTLGAMQHALHPRSGQWLRDFPVAAPHARSTPCFPAEDPAARTKSEPRVETRCAVLASIDCDEKMDNPFLSSSTLRAKHACLPSTCPSPAGFAMPCNPSPLYDCGFSVHAELPQHRSLVEPLPVPPHLLHQVSLLGGYDDRLDQQPVLFGTVDNLSSLSPSTQYGLEPTSKPAPSKTPKRIIK